MSHAENIQRQDPIRLRRIEPLQTPFDSDVTPFDQSVNILIMWGSLIGKSLVLLTMFLN
jgi:hypothetical protein